MRDDPPLLKLLAGLVCLLLTLLPTTLPVDLKLTQPTISVKLETIPNDQFVLINNNSVLGLTSPPGNDKVSASWTGIEKLDEIMWYESRGDSTVCNKQYGCGSGIGKGQLTAIAIEDCEKNLGKKIDPWNDGDNIECSIWLYETYGTKPWGTADTWWGSYRHWGNK